MLSTSRPRFCCIRAREWAAAMAMLSVTRLASTIRQPLSRPGKHMELFTWLGKSLRPVATMKAPAALASWG